MTEKTILRRKFLSELNRISQEFINNEEELSISVSIEPKYHETPYSDKRYKGEIRNRDIVTFGSPINNYYISIYSDCDIREEDEAVVCDIYHGVISSIMRKDGDYSRIRVKITELEKFILFWLFLKE